MSRGPPGAPSLRRGRSPASHPQATTGQGSRVRWAASEPSSRQAGRTGRRTTSGGAALARSRCCLRASCSCTSRGRPAASSVTPAESPARDSAHTSHASRSRVAVDWHGGHGDGDGHDRRRYYRGCRLRSGSEPCSDDRIGRAVPASPPWALRPSCWQQAADACAPGSSRDGQASVALIGAAGFLVAFATVLTGLGEDSPFGYGFFPGVVALVVWSIAVAAARIRTAPRRASRRDASPHGLVGTKATSPRLSPRVRPSRVRAALGAIRLGRAKRSAPGMTAPASVSSHCSRSDE